MAIKITTMSCADNLQGKSHWWGFPDLPKDVEWPCRSDEELLTFICQINCEDIAAFDTEGKLPHEGMLYFFAAIDKWIGYDSPTQNGAGEWSKGHFVVKYAKSINFETFQSCMMVDDNDESLTEKEMEIVFSECLPDEKCIKLLGTPSSEEVAKKYPDMINFLQLVAAENFPIEFEGELNLMIKPQDLGYGNWKKVVAHL